MSIKWVSIIIALLLAVVQSGLVQANASNDCLVQPSDEQVTLQLDPSCPLGDGLWGDVAPTDPDSSLWIQCRFDSFPLSEQAYTFLYANVSGVIVEQHDGKGYRCLIGPYLDHKQARLEQQHLKNYPHFSTVFLREVK